MLNLYFGLSTRCLPTFTRVGANKSLGQSWASLCTYMIIYSVAKLFMQPLTVIAYGGNVISDFFHLNTSVDGIIMWLSRLLALFCQVNMKSRWKLLFDHFTLSLTNLFFKRSLKCYRLVIFILISPLKVKTLEFILKNHVYFVHKIQITIIRIKQREYNVNVDGKFKMENLILLSPQQRHAKILN